MKPIFITTPGGEDLVILSRADFDRMAEAGESAAEDADDIALSDAVMAARGETAPLSPRENADVLIRNGLIKAARKAKGMSQQELAAAVGVAQGFISDVEAGRKRGTDETMAAIARAIGVEPEQLGVGAAARESARMSRAPEVGIPEDATFYRLGDTGWAYGWRGDVSRAFDTIQEAIEAANTGAIARASALQLGQKAVPSAKSGRFHGGPGEESAAEVAARLRRPVKS